MNERIFAALRNCYQVMCSGSLEVEAMRAWIALMIDALKNFTEAEILFAVHRQIKTGKKLPLPAHLIEAAALYREVTEFQKTHCAGASS